MDHLPEDVLNIILQHLSAHDLLSFSAVSPYLSRAVRDDVAWARVIRARSGAAAWCGGVRAPQCRVLRDPLLCGGVPLWQLAPLMPIALPHALRESALLRGGCGLAAAGRRGAGGACAGTAAHAAPPAVPSRWRERAVLANHPFPAFPTVEGGGAATLPWAWAPPVSRAQLALTGGGGDLRAPADSALFAGAYIVAYFEVSICTVEGGGGEDGGGGGGGGGRAAPEPEPVVAVGLARAEFPLSGKMPGWDLLSWGYHGDDGRVFHGHGRGEAYGPRFGVGDTVGCGVVFAGALRGSAHLRGSLFEEKVGAAGGECTPPFLSPPPPPPQPHSGLAAAPLETPRCAAWGALPAGGAAAAWPGVAADSAPCDTLFFTKNGSLLGPVPLPTVDTASAWYPCAGVDATVQLDFNFGAQPGAPFAFDVRGFNVALLGALAGALPRLPRVPRAVRVEVARESSAQLLSAARLFVSPPPPPALAAGAAGGGSGRPSPPRGGGAALSPPHGAGGALARGDGAGGEGAASILGAGGGREDADARQGGLAVLLLSHAMRGRQLLVASGRLRGADAGEGGDGSAEEGGASGRRSLPPPLTPARCAECGRGGAALECSRCNGIRYCGRACQEAHWHVHVRACDAAARGTPTI
jgi:hypothetical protein